ncbi:glycoside hydrolase family 3 protein [bacterium NHP-B]|nr:glycoside hydrolase family 3 protein [bacterium NHP-B]
MHHTDAASLATKPIMPLFLGIEGLSLTPEEQAFFANSNPLGFILFRRNIESEQQLKNLVHQLATVTGRLSLPLLVDCEGGRVFRLPSAMMKTPPPPRHFGDVYTQSPEKARRACYENYHTMGRYLHTLGLSVNCAPLLDLSVAGATDALEDRTFSDDPHVVADLGLSAVRALQDAGIVPVIKHMPGHGAAREDSHLVCPSIHLTAQELERHRHPFHAVLSHAEVKASPVPLWGMTAHVAYDALDPQVPATFSPRVIQHTLRQTLGFEGFLMSDDLAMGAVSHEPPDVRVRKALAAGCDGVIFGKGGVAVYAQALKGAIPLSEATKKRLSFFLS